MAAPALRYFLFFSTFDSWDLLIAAVIIGIVFIVSFRCQLGCGYPHLQPDFWSDIVLTTVFRPLLFSISALLLVAAFTGWL